MGPILYLIYTTGLATATIADDRALLSSHIDLTIRLHQLQYHLYNIESKNNVKIKINQTKSAQVTFTNK